LFDVEKCTFIYDDVNATFDTTVNRYSMIKKAVANERYFVNNLSGKIL